MLWFPVENQSACTNGIEHMGEILQIPLLWISGKHGKVSVIPNSQLAHMRFQMELFLLGSP